MAPHATAAHPLPLGPPAKRKYLFTFIIPFLSYPISSYYTPSHLIISHLVLLYPILSYHTSSRLILFTFMLTNINTSTYEELALSSAEDLAVGRAGRAVAAPGTLGFDAQVGG